MKKIVCELCEGTEFIKENGMFVCQGCGTKYSTEEARSMMREVEGEASATTGSLIAGTSMGNPNQSQIDNILVLATTAYEAQNYAESENYCNKAIELDALCYKAWNLKGKAVGWQSKIDNLRIEEAAHSFCKAIDFAPEEEKEEVKNQAVEELKKLGIALISLRKQRFGGNPDTQELNGFTSDKKTILNALLVLLSHGNVVGIPEGFLEEVASLMEQAGVAALNMARTAWKAIEHPSKKDLDTYIDWNHNIAQVFLEAINTSADDDEADIQRYRYLIIALEEPMNINACSYKQVWHQYTSSFVWEKEYDLAEPAKTIRRNQVARYKEKRNELQMKVSNKKAADARKAAEEKRARIVAYWEAHADEKAKLEAEKADLEEKKGGLSTEISSIESDIKALDPNGTVPAEEESNRIREQIRDLERQQSNLGMFAGKQRKQISEEIATLSGRRNSLMSKIEDEKKARRAAADVKMAPLQEKKDNLCAELGKVTKRITAIEAELTKDPGE